MFTAYTSFQKKVKKASSTRNKSLSKKLIKQKRAYLKLKSTNAKNKKISIDIAFAMDIIDLMAQITYESAQLPHSRKDRKNSKIRFCYALACGELMYEELKTLFNISSSQLTSGKKTYAAGVTKRKNNMKGKMANASTQTVAFNYLQDYMLYDITQLQDLIYQYVVTGKIRKSNVIEYMVYWHQADRICCRDMMELDTITKNSITKSFNAFLKLKADDFKKDTGIDVEAEEEGGEESEYIDSSLLSGDGTINNPYVVDSIDINNIIAMYGGKIVILIENSYYTASGFVYHYYNGSFAGLLEGSGTEDDPYILSRIIISAVNNNTTVSLIVDCYYKINGKTYYYLGDGILTDVTRPNMKGDGTIEFPFCVDSIFQSALAVVDGYTMTVDSGQYYKVKSTGDVYLMTKDGILEKKFTASPEIPTGGGGTSIPGVFGDGSINNPFIVDEISVYAQTITNNGVDIDFNSTEDVWAKYNFKYWLVKNSKDYYVTFVRNLGGEDFKQMILMSKSDADEWIRENTPGGTQITVGGRTAPGIGTKTDPYVVDKIDEAKNDVVFNGESIKLEEHVGHYFVVTGIEILYQVVIDDNEGFIIQKASTSSDVVIEFRESGTKADPYKSSWLEYDSNAVYYDDIKINISADEYDGKYFTWHDMLYQVVNKTLTPVLNGNGTINNPYLVNYISTVDNVVMHQGMDVSLVENAYYAMISDPTTVYVEYEGKILTPAEKEIEKAEQSTAETDDSDEIVIAAGGDGSYSNPYIVDSSIVDDDGNFYLIYKGNEVTLVNDCWYHVPGAASNLVVYEGELMSEERYDSIMEEAGDGGDIEEDNTTDYRGVLKGEGTYDNPYVVNTISPFANEVYLGDEELELKEGAFYTTNGEYLYVVVRGVLCKAEEVYDEGEEE